MNHHLKGAGNYVIIAAVTLVILLALLLLVFNRSQESQSFDGTVPPQNAVDPAPLERSTEPETQTSDQPADALGSDVPDAASLSDPEVETETGAAPGAQIPPETDKQEPGETQQEVSADNPVTEETTYTVSDGETLASIAREHNTSITALAEANSLADPNRLAIGQVLSLPNGNAEAPVGESRAPVEQPGTRKTYTVKPGDTLYAIATRHNTTPDAVSEINQIPEIALIQVGQVLDLPNASAEPK